MYIDLNMEENKQYFQFVMLFFILRKVKMLHTLSKIGTFHGVDNINSSFQCIMLEIPH